MYNACICNYTHIYIGIELHSYIRIVYVVFKQTECIRIWMQVSYKCPEFNALMVCIMDSWVGCNADYGLPRYVIIISRDSRNVG